MLHQPIAKRDGGLRAVLFDVVDQILQILDSAVRPSNEIRLAVRHFFIRRLKRCFSLSLPSSCEIVGSFIRDSSRSWSSRSHRASYCSSDKNTPTTSEFWVTATGPFP